MHQAELIWEQAEAAVVDDEALKWRVQQALLSVHYVWLCRWEEFQKAAAAKGDRWLLGPSRKAIADLWLKTATNPGPLGWTPMTRIEEGGRTPQQFVAQFAKDPIAPGQ